jgi:hypothetical protein
MEYLAAQGYPVPHVYDIVTIGTADLPPSPAAAARAWYLRALRRASAADPGPRMADAARAKLADQNRSETEAVRMRAVIARAERRG